MSKNIAIQEGGVAKQLTVDKLKTNLVGGGDCTWIPEDEATLTTKTITKDGTYKAKNDGYYGYSEVTVHGIGKATGKDSNGNDAVAHTDPNTGKIVIDTVPSSIVVVTPPTNPYGIYQNGQTITTDGMVVKAYLEDETEYGTVPNGEITLNPTTAVYDPSTDPGGGDIADYSGDTSSWPYPDVHSVSTDDTLYANFTDREETYKINGGYIVVFTSLSADSVPFVIFSESNNATYTKSVHYPAYPQNDYTQTKALNYSKSTYSGKTFYYAADSLYVPTSVSMSSCGMPEMVDTVHQVGTILFDGTITPVQAGSRQTITVSWPRPMDYEELTTTFEILVAPGYTPNS